MLVLRNLFVHLTNPFFVPQVFVLNTHMSVPVLDLIIVQVMLHLAVLVVFALTHHYSAYLLIKEMVVMHFSHLKWVLHGISVAMLKDQTFVVMVLAELTMLIVPNSKDVKILINHISVLMVTVLLVVNIVTLRILKHVLKVLEDVKMVFVDQLALTLMVAHYQLHFNVQTVSVLLMKLNALVRVLVHLIILSDVLTTSVSLNQVCVLNQKDSITLKTLLWMFLLIRPKICNSLWILNLTRNSPPWLSIQEPWSTQIVKWSLMVNIVKINLKTCQLVLVLFLILCFTT